MKTILTMALFSATAMLLPAQVTTTNSYNGTSALIPEGSPVGLTEQFTASGVSGSVADVQVSLDITGGFNGNLYAYLVGPQGQLAVLLNRVGVSGGNPFGYSDAGFNITLDGQAVNNIHNYQSESPTVIGGQLTGTWVADGRNIDPQSPGSMFDMASTGANMDIFQNTEANGTWTLFIADLSSGGGTASLNSVVLSIMTVPEPQTWLMVGSGLPVLIWRRLRR